MGRQTQIYLRIEKEYEKLNYNREVDIVIIRDLIPLCFINNHGEGFLASAEQLIGYIGRKEFAATVTDHNTLAKTVMRVTDQYRVNGQMHISISSDISQEANILFGIMDDPIDKNAYIFDQMGADGSFYVDVKYDKNNNPDIMYAFTKGEDMRPISANEWLCWDVPQPKISQEGHERAAKIDNTFHLMNAEQIKHFTGIDKVYEQSKQHIFAVNFSGYGGEQIFMQVRDADDVWAYSMVSQAGEVISKGQLPQEGLRIDQAAEKILSQVNVEGFSPDLHYIANIDQEWAQRTMEHIMNAIDGEDIEEIPDFEGMEEDIEPEKGIKR